MSRRVNAVHKGKADEYLWLVKCHIILHPVAKTLRNQRGVLRKPAGHVRIQPAAPFVQFVGHIPVVQSQIGGNPVFQHLVNQITVKSNSLLIHRTGSLRQHSGPGNRETVRLHSQLCHQADILFVPVVVVTGNIAVMALKYLSRLMTVSVPDGQPFSVLKCRSLYLIGACRNTPYKIV